MKSILSFFTLLFFIASVNGQKLDIQGYVHDNDSGEAIIGASVTVKGMSIGTATDLDGNYELSIPSPDSETTLVFSYLGYVDQEILVSGSTKIDVNLREGGEELEEVVITAFGIRKEKKLINYAIQDVGGEDVANSKQDNIVNSLNGKIAGVQVTNSSGSAGASSQILIRGANSVSDDVNNQPLFIVDGLPIDNSASFGGGNRAMDINPEDVASISVLKGPAAAALYGLEAANGAIIITTKSATEGKAVVSFGANVSFEQPVRLNPRQQNFKQGSQGVFDNEITSSWGPLFIPNDTTYDNVGEFFNTGVKQKYDLSISSGNKVASVYFSGNFIDQEGIFPGENYGRLGALIKGTAKVSENISIQASSNLIRSTNVRSGSGSMYNVYRWPRNNQMSNYLNDDKSKRWLIDRPEGSEWINPENPYWRAENNTINDRVNRTISMASLTWNIINDLSLVYRIGTDITNQHYKSLVRPQSAGSAQNFQGRISERERSFVKTNSTFLLDYSKRLGNGINISGLLGNNIQIEDAMSTSIAGSTYRNPGLDNINNLEQIEATQSLLRRRVVGVYGDLKVDYKSTFFIGVTGRNDWSSTLPTNNNSFFYPSVNAGVILSELFESRDIFSYAKLRGNWAQVGKDAPAHRLTAVLEPYQTIGGGFKYDYYAGNPNLKPETTQSWEVGADVRFFKGRTRLDFTYYESKSIDQIIQSRISTASGWVILAFNSGSIENKGVEMILAHDIFRGKKFNWEFQANFSSNNSKLIELPSFVSKYPVTVGQVISAAKPSSVIGFPLMAIEGRTYLRNENGQVVLDEEGYPRFGAYIGDGEGGYEQNSDGTRKVDNQSVYLGDREPDWILGLNNNLSYGNLTLSSLVDFRYGGDVLNATNAVMIGNGTAGYLDDYRNKSIVFDGVTEQEGEFVENNNRVILNQGYFANTYASVGENFVEDASWIRLRYISLQYRLPSSLLENISAQNITFSVTGRNLALWTRYSGGDPETNYAGSGIGGTGTMGLDYFNVPAVQGLDFSIKANF